MRTRPGFCCCRRTRTSAASPSTSSSTSGSSSTPASAPTSTSRAIAIYTTLDLDTQQAAERALEARLEAIESGADGKFTWPTYRQYLDSRADTPDNGSRTMTPYLQGLVVTLDAKTGNIRAMVGGRDFEDSKFNRATQALRQPGSTFKPIVYAAALEAGYPLSHVMVDDPLTVEMATDEAPWAPQNYDLEFDGPDDAAPRALHVAQHHRHQAGHGDRRGRGDQRGHQVRHHDAAFRPIPRSTSARRT